MKLPSGFATQRDLMLFAFGVIFGALELSMWGARPGALVLVGAVLGTPLMLRAEEKPPSKGGPS